MKAALSALLFLAAAICNAQNIIPTQAKKYMGDVVTVCGEVTSAQRSQDLEQHPTLLGFGPKFPSEDFSIVILDRDIHLFTYNPRDLFTHNVCVTGEIVKLFGRPGILVTDPLQIEDQGDEDDLSDPQGSAY